MLKDFAGMLKDRLDKEAAILDEVKDEFRRRVEWNKSIKEKFENIGAEVPGFDNDDPMI